ELVVLASSAPQYHWVLPAVQARLQAELARLELKIDASDRQTADLARGEKLLVLGYELRYGTDKHGPPRALYHRVHTPVPPQAEVPAAKPRVQRTSRGRLGPIAGWRRAMRAARFKYAVLAGTVLLLGLGVILFRPAGQAATLRHEVFVRATGDR